METLTPRRRQVLDYIYTFVEERGYPPSIREIAEHLGVSGTRGVVGHLEALERRGLLRRERGSSRGIAVTRQEGVRLPVAGTVQAGLPQPAAEDIDDYLSLDPSLARDGAFFLRVRGDSMINASIRDGDLALVRPQPTAQNRDIVIAMVEGEATLKRFYREPGRIRLQPENPNMEPIFVRAGEAEVAIVGKVIGIWRSLP